MAKHDDINLTYTACENELLDKELASCHFLLEWLNKLSMMFEWENLPKTMPKRYLEWYLLTNGNCLACKADNGNMYCFTGGLSGQEMSPYFEPTEYIVANPALNLFKTFKIDEDGVLIRNDSKMLGIMPILRKYAAILIESDITGRNCLVNMRMQKTISASDNKTYQSALKYLENVKAGKLGVIADTAFIDGLKISESTSNTSYYQGLIEITQYFKAQFLNEIGLNANYNMKREYISDSENVLNDDVLLPYADNMLYERQIAVKKINEIFGTEISVDFASSWKTNNMENAKQVAIANNAVTLTESGVKSNENETADKDASESENAVTSEIKADKKEIDEQSDNKETIANDNDTQIEDKDDEKPTV